MMKSEEAKNVTLEEKLRTLKSWFDKPMPERNIEYKKNG